MKGDEAPETDLARGLVGIRVSHRNLERFSMGFPGIYSRQFRVLLRKFHHLDGVKRGK